MKLGAIPTKQLLSTKTGNIGLFLVGTYFCLITLLLTGAVDYPNLILGLTFIACAIVNAKPSPQVLSGMLVGFVGLVNLLSISDVLPIDTAWMLTLICVVGVFILEFAGLKFGKASNKAKVAIVIPMFSLFFMFVLAILQMNPALSVDWATNSVKFINYVALMFLTGLLSLEFLGWKVMKKNHGMWITVLGLLCIVTSFFGVYQTLMW